MMYLFNNNFNNKSSSYRQTRIREIINGGRFTAKNIVFIVSKHAFSLARLSSSLFQKCSLTNTLKASLIVALKHLAFYYEL